MKRALILGCSHASGAEMAKAPGVIINDSIEFEEYGGTRSYPVKIANMLGYTALNHAVAGGSNDAMFRIWDKEKQQLTNNDIVIACWTGYDRSEFWNEKTNSWMHATHSGVTTNVRFKNKVLLEGLNSPGKALNSSQYETYHRYWVLNECNEQRGRLNKIKNIEALNYQAQRLGIRVINIDSFHPVWDLDKDNSWPVDITFCHWAEDRNSLKTDWGHYFEPTHSAFAEYVVAQLNGS